MAPLLILPFSEKEKKLMVPSDRNMPDPFDSFRSLWPGADPGGKMRGMHPPTRHFQKCFKCIQFFHNFESLR